MTDSTNQLPATVSPTNSQCAASTPQPRSSWLQPATAKQGSAELLACLTLVAPTGMTGEERSQWLAIARETLSGIPGDLLSYGCKAARLKCRFPSEIVPAIMAEVGASWENRKRSASISVDRRESMSLPAPLKPDRVDPAEVAKILAEFGLKGGQA